MVAYGTGKAGQFAKGKADVHLRAYFTGTMVALFGIGILCGLLLAFSVEPVVNRYVPLGGRPPTLATVATLLGLLAAAMVVTWLLCRYALRAADRQARLRVKALTGGQAEALVAYALSGLDDGWHLFNGVAMKGGGDVDHVLVGPGGLFCLSTKSARGAYAVDAAGRLTLNGDACDHAADAQRRAMQLRNWLEAMLHADRSVASIPWVQPVLVAPFAHVGFPARRSNVWVMDERELLAHAIEAGRSLKPATVDGCVAALQRLTGWQTVPAKVGGPPLEHPSTRQPISG